MTRSDRLETFNVPCATLEAEWVVMVQTPIAGLKTLLEVLGREIGLVQGSYDNCAYVTGQGQQRFRGREGAHSGPEDAVQSTASVEISFSIPRDMAVLRKVFSVTYQHHVHEEPTIRVQEAWGGRAKDMANKDNPNRYWNRPDAAEIHGEAISTPDKSP
mgnify:CR=1 FL=1